MTTEAYPKRLIEVDLPIREISEHARREKSIRHGHISTLHIWWARRPLAACRAVICAALWLDPADPLCPQGFRDAAAEILLEFAAQARTQKGVRALVQKHWSRWNRLGEGAWRPKDPDCWWDMRYALLDFIADFANWDASSQPDFLKTACGLTSAAHAALGNGAPRPIVLDPFAGGGAIPFEAVRIGADAFASDLNPVAVLLNRVALEFVPRYGADLTNAVREQADWIRAQIEDELSDFYPSSDPYESPLAYLWARVIRCEAPGCGAEVPLLRSLWLAKKKGRAIALEMTADRETNTLTFRVIEGSEVDKASTDRGTVSKGSATCPVCGFSMKVSRVRAQLRTVTGGASTARLLAVATSRAGQRGRFYREPTEADFLALARAEEALRLSRDSSSTDASFVPEESTAHYHSFVNRGPIYGMTEWSHYYTPRQLLTLASIANLIKRTPTSGEIGVAARTCLALALDKQADLTNSLVRWEPIAECPRQLFGRQAIPMVWDFAESVPVGDSSGSWEVCVRGVLRALQSLQSARSDGRGTAQQASATDHPLPDDSVDAVVTDPPYYYSVQYADLSDFFYVWLKRSIGEIYPGLLTNSLTPKDDEIIVQSPGHEFASEGKNSAYYEARMEAAMAEARRVVVPSGVGVVVFAHKATAGWESMLRSLNDAGWVITASWPIDTENASRLLSQGRAVLASSIHLVCRPRERSDGALETESVGDWRAVLRELPERIHEWMPRLASEGIVGADAIFSCLGPALEVFSRYARVEKASGERVELREYLEHVWAAVAREALSMIFEDADASGFEEDARLTAMWLWTLSTSTNGSAASDPVEAAPSAINFGLEYDAARKIAQGLGAHLEDLDHVVEIKSDYARLLNVAERTRYLFGRSAPDEEPRRRAKRTPQMSLFRELEEAEKEAVWGETGALTAGESTLDRVHQAMILFAANRGEALRRFVVDEGVGREPRFWKLAQSLAALYPAGTEERRWVEGLLARKKSLGFG